MYKKTTTIIEEHGNSGPDGAPLGNIFSNIPNENTNLGIATRLNWRNYYSLYAIYMREYLNIAIAKGSTSGIKNTISNHTNSQYLKVLSPWIAPPIVTQEAGDALIAASVTMADSICASIDAIAINKNREVAIANTQKSITDFCNSLNAVIYLIPKDGSANILNSYFNTIVVQADNRIAGEWGLDSTAYYSGYDILASTVVPGTVTFADAMSNAIIQWQPWRFN